MLSHIQSHISRFTDVIASVVGIDVEILDTRFTRLAGTGIHAIGIGERATGANLRFEHAMRTRSPVLVENPREHELCHGCLKRDECKETLALSAPIIDGDAVLGIIGLTCVNVWDRDRVLEQQQFFTDFVTQMADLIGYKATEQQRIYDALAMLDVLTQVLEVNERGIILFNAKKKVTYCNELARTELDLGAKELPKEFGMKKTGNSLAEADEFELTSEGKKILVMGQFTSIQSESSDFTSALIFESLPRIARRANELSSADSSTHVDSIVGKSRKIAQLKQDIIRLAPSPSTILVTGESGTGKELVARAMHAASSRSGQPFVAINCGGIPETLLESEFFGYVRGAFTGALSSGKIGKFELAHTGTLFLDEISAMPLYLQVKLLRVLQERQITRLGSNNVIDVDVRVIAATNENLLEKCATGMFRSDLYYRLNVIPLEIPPLRERKEDIPLLATHFMDAYCRRFGKSAGKIPHYIVSTLKKYDWPGNVREFANCMEYIANAMPREGHILVEHLPPQLQTLGAGREPKSPMTLTLMEKEAIAEALLRYPATQAGKKLAAKELGIGIATLYRKIKAYNLDTASL